MLFDVGLAVIKQMQSQLIFGAEDNFTLVNILAALLTLKLLLLLNHQRIDHLLAILFMHVFVLKFVKNFAS